MQLFQIVHTMLFCVRVRICAFVCNSVLQQEKTLYLFDLLPFERHYIYVIGYQQFFS